MVTPGIRARFTLLVLLALAASRGLIAHDVPIEHVVDLVVEPRGGDLLVRAHLPAAVVGDANLPRQLDGTFDPGAVADRLPIIAADFARNLDLQQGDASLLPTVDAARIGADRASIDIELRYPGGHLDELSGRLNAVRAAGAPVRTNLRYRLPTGRDHVVSVTGQPARMAFDPARGEVVAQFIGRGVRALLDGGDHLLFLVCVLLPMRRTRFLLAIFAAAASAQAAAIAVTVVGPATEPVVAAMSMVAASAVVMAALQNITRAREQLVVLLALVFGVANGASFGRAFVIAEPMAWSHATAAALVFAATVLVGELWLGALAWATRTWLDERGLPERVAAILASALIIHSAMHRFVDRGHLLAQAGSFTTAHAMVWVTLAWLAVMLAVALAAGISRRRGTDGRLGDPAGAQS